MRSVLKVLEKDYLGVKRRMSWRIHEISSSPGADAFRICQEPLDHIIFNKECQRGDPYLGDPLLMYRRLRGNFEYA